MKKSLFALFSVIVFVGFLPVLAISWNSSMREHITTKTDKRWEDTNSLTFR